MVFKNKKNGVFFFELSLTTAQHFVSFAMYIVGANFEEHCSNISIDTLDSVVDCFSGTIYDVIISLICKIKKNVSISKMKK